MPCSITFHLTPLRQGLSLNLKLVTLDMLAGQQAPRIHLSLLAWPGVIGAQVAFLGVYMGWCRSKLKLSGLHSRNSVTKVTSPAPNLHFYIEGFI